MTVPNMTRFMTKGWRCSTRWLLPALFLLSLMAVLMASAFVPTVAQYPRQEIRGVWMTTNDTDILRDHAKLQDAVGQLARLNFNTIYPVVWNAGYAMYPSTVVQQAGIQSFVYRGIQGQDILADLIAQGHARGMLIVPWFEFGFMAPPTSELATKYANWLTQKQDGTKTSMSAAGEVVWLNPFRPEVQQFISSLVLEIVTRYDADGIQFDDHMSLPNEFGYDSYTISLYQKETGKTPPADPKDPDWVRWRANKITAFMVQLHNAVKAVKPQAIFSISPNYYDFAYRFHLQDWLAWVRQNAVDELIVQVYRPNLQSFLEQITRSEIREARQKIPTGIGILTGLRNNPVAMSMIQAQTQSARAQGLGICFFYYESLWDYAPEPPEQRQAGFQSLFPYQAVRSTRL
ncbi:family 10 glycosylhydrolase [Leptolyngbya sp. NK1-12]|uniref:Family 10 glycosylhydrolase n=1 Tax=Leptolyngbya sp. NK1-12 TaxID=2547451 RepID=A0AA96WSJ3_9CYAN|nr:glycoside hydrolase family 10 protein [Leptolyngbya sp. NK1-12]WNZ22002.1 family 10 glycosylhydrolase [Leptolyngbya sp. NK1-12]